MLSLLLQFLMIAYSFVSSQDVCSVSSTGSDIPGPFYLSGAPNRAILYDPDDEGIRLTLDGTVTNLECEPLSNVYIDFWQANPNGVYDGIGYKFRGGLYTDSNGKYEIYTLYPGTYSGRPVHIHVKLFIDDILILTTQIYFHGYIGNDPWYDTQRAIKPFPETLDNTSFTATFNFIGDWQQSLNIATTKTTTETTTTSTTATKSPITTATTTKLPITTSSTATKLPITTATTTKSLTTTAPITTPQAAICCNCLITSKIGGGTTECQQDTQCQDVVCNVGDNRFQYNPDPYCCNTRWDNVCVTEAQYICDDNNNNNPTDDDVPSATTSDPTPSPTDIPTPSPSNNPTETSALICCECLISSTTSGGTRECQNDIECQNIVCNVGDERFRYNPDRYCCDNQWDNICVNEAGIICNDNMGSVGNAQRNDKLQDETVHRNQMGNDKNTDSNEYMIWFKYGVICLIVVVLLIAVGVLLYKYYSKKRVQFHPVSTVSNETEMNKNIDTEIKNGEKIEMVETHNV